MDLKDGCCYPDINEIRSNSVRIAVAVAKHIFETGRSEKKDLGGYGKSDWFQLMLREAYYPDYSSVGPFKNLSPNSPWLKLYQLNVLYRFYITDEIVEDWNEFVYSVYEMKSGFDEWKIDGRTYLNFVDNWNKKFGFDVELFIDYVGRRRLYFDGYTVEDQKTIINDCENYEFPSEVQPFVTEMLRRLKTVTEFQYIRGNRYEERHIHYSLMC
jgi:hypothetical protein